jgi:hypothetical protein
MDEPMPVQGFWSAIEHVLNYLYDEELAHYRDALPEEREGHIFESLFVLGCHLDLAQEQGQFVRFDS